jgi:hypothetical protein
MLKESKAKQGHPRTLQAKESKIGGHLKAESFKAHHLVEWGNKIRTCSENSDHVMVPQAYLHQVLSLIRVTPLLDALQTTDSKCQFKGWRLLKDLSGPFLFYKRKDEWKVELSPQLKEIRNRLLTGHREHPKKKPPLEEALLLIAYAYDVQSPRSGAISANNRVGKHVFRLLVEAIGESLTTVISADNVPKSSNAADATLDSLRRAIRGIYNTYHREKSVGGGEAVDRALVAQFMAQALCQQLKRQPRKSELRRLMETSGFSFGKSKDLRAKFNALFERAGLGDLEE